jgi:hypothetical protein
MPKACVCVAIVAALLAVHSAASLLLPESKAADPLAAKLRFGLIVRRRFAPTNGGNFRRPDQHSTANPPWHQRAPPGRSRPLVSVAGLRIRSALRCHAWYGCTVAHSLIIAHCTLEVADSPSRARRIDGCPRGYLGPGGTAGGGAWAQCVGGVAGRADALIFGVAHIHPRPTEREPRLPAVVLQ